MYNGPVDKQQQEIPPIVAPPYEYPEITKASQAIIRTPVCYTQAYINAIGDQTMVSDVGGDYIFKFFSLGYAVAGPLLVDLVYVRLTVQRPSASNIFNCEIILKPGSNGGQSMDNLCGNPDIVLHAGDSIHVFISQGNSTTYQAIATVTLQPYK